jgi:hypothetical protein
MVDEKIRARIAIAQAVSRRSPIAEARVRSQVSPWGIFFFFDKVALRRVFHPSTSVFPCFSFIPPVLHYAEKRKN